MKMRARIFLIFSAVLVSGAVLAGVARAQAVVQAYQTTDSLQLGMIVELAKDNTARVETAKQDSTDKVHGVVVAANDAPISLTNPDGKQQVYVATSGDYQVLVSDQNGAIAKDDYVTVSSLDGVGMKAGSTQQYIIGKALDGFNGSIHVLGKTTVKDTQGKERTVSFGYVKVAVNVGHNPKYEAAASNVPDFLQELTTSVANKPVSAIRIYISLGILLATVVIVFSVLYAGIRTSVISLGRNPLAKKSILRNLIQIILTSLIVLILGIFGVYLLLRI